MIMDDFIQPPRKLSDVPVLADLEPAATRRSRPSRTVYSPDPDGGFGVFAASEVQAFADRMADGLIEWSQVVELRRRASEAITDESEAEVRRTGRPLPAEDRLLLGRAIIGRVVADHVRALHREGADLWSTER
jgi:pilus assembly protein CpaF